jgi:hypothetical protein
VRVYDLFAFRRLARFAIRELFTRVNEAFTTKYENRGGKRYKNDTEQEPAKEFHSASAPIRIHGSVDTPTLVARQASLTPATVRKCTTCTGHAQQFWMSLNSNITPANLDV